ncbi:MAG: YjbF family lipoprotein [Alphaproteobacteria bacterium]|nr:YjbF family lipoprotein [Alphaproteobacteria bacterium]
MRVSRRTILSCGLASLASGCGDVAFPRTVKKLYGAVAPLNEQSFDRSYVDQIPYACMRATLGRSPVSLLILGGVNGSDLTWFSADKAAIVTRSGRIIRSAGFPHNLKNTIFYAQDPIATPWPADKETATLTRVVDLEIAGLYGIVVTSEITNAGAEQVTPLDIAIPVVHLVETCRCRGVDWEFENHFWKDMKTGFVWRSVQTFVPNVPPLEMDVLRAY